MISQLFLAGASLEIPATRSSPASNIPQEIIEMIIAHLICDTRSLLACSLTCYSWYIASVPHLHHTLITLGCRCDFSPKLGWAKPLQNASKLGLLPLVKKFHIQGSPSFDSSFPRQQFNSRILRQISEMTNIRVLGIHGLDIPSFMPEIQHCFGHFLPRVQSLSLRAPRGSCRQIIFFIGLFEHLENLGLYDGKLQGGEHEAVDDPAFIPPFTPPLRGRLAMECFMGAGFLKDMIRLLGGVQFRYMNLVGVGDMRLLLNACAKTLEKLRLYPNDPSGEQW